MNDEISKQIVEVINNSREPLETKEVGELVNKILKDVTRTKLFYRLTMLRADGLVKGKFVGPGKGVWIWWRTDVLKIGKVVRSGKS